MIKELSVGKKLRKVREEFGLSQESMAMILNVSRQAITKWELDKGIPDIDNLKNISKAFSISIDDILDLNYTKELNSIRIVLNKTSGHKNYKDFYKEIATYIPASFEVYNASRKRKMGFLGTIFDIFIVSGNSVIVDNAIDSSQYYILTNNERKLLLKFNDNFMDIKKLSPDCDINRFEINNQIYKKRKKCIIKR